MAALKTLFSLKENETSQPFVLGSNVIVAKCISVTKDDVNEKDGYSAEAANYDRGSASVAIMTSKDLKNDFFKAYQKYFTGSY